MAFSLCVVGCGRFARTFVKAIRAFEKPGGETELYFASRDSAKAAAYCHRFGGAGDFGNYAEAASDPRIQAMYLCTPNSLHLEHALMAAGKGKHILVEKPLAPTLEEGERMVAAAKDAGVKLMVAENYRFLPVVEKCRDLIRQGAIGQMRFIQIQEESNFAVEGWRSRRDMMGGGVFIDGGIHSANILIELAGMPVEVYASSLPRSVRSLDGEDGMVMMVRLPGGAAGLINHAWGISRTAWKLWVAVSGTKGRVYFRPRGTSLVLETEEGKSRFRFPEDRAGIGAMVQEFRDSIAENRPPLTSGQVGLRDLKVVINAYESAAKGAPVAVVE